MKPDLLLFTDHYPFGTSEPFLSDELPYLSQQFRHILIIPLDTSNNSPQRKIPENAQVFNPSIKNYKSKISLIFRGLMGKGNLQLLIKELFQSGALRNSYKLLHWFVVALIIRTYLPVFNKVVRALEHPENTVIYFYWGQRWSQILPFITPVFREVIIRMHGSDLYEYLYQDYIPFRKQQMEAANKVFLISKIGETYLNDRYPGFNSKIQLARLGTADRGLNPINISEEKPFIIVSCAGLIKIKRIPLIPVILRFTTCPIRWYHFGGGPEMAQLVKECQHLPDNISCKLMGQISHDEFMQFYQTNHVDLFLNVSVTEGVPVSIMEAFSFGIPVIATDVGGTGELVNNQNGQLIPKDFVPSEVGKLIDQLLANNTIIDLRIAARKTWAERANTATVYPEFIRMLTADFLTLSRS